MHTIVECSDIVLSGFANLLYKSNLILNSLLWVICNISEQCSVVVSSNERIKIINGIHSTWLEASLVIFCKSKPTDT